MSRICTLAVTLLMTVAVAGTASAAEPIPFKAVYKARFKGFPIGATGVRELRKMDNGTWLLTSRAHNFLGTIEEETRFTLGKDNRIVPEEYQYHRTGIGPHRSTVLKFDWDNKQITEDGKDKPWDLSLATGTQDRLSYQFMLRNDLTTAYREDQPWPTLTYHIADDGEVIAYSFRVVGEETVKTPIGKFKTIKATRTNGNPNRVTNFWLAPAYNFLLIRFEQTEPNGHGFELLLRQAEFDGKKIVAAGD